MGGKEPPLKPTILMCKYNSIEVGEVVCITPFLFYLKDYKTPPRLETLELSMVSLGILILRYLTPSPSLLAPLLPPLCVVVRVEAHGSHVLD